MSESSPEPDPAPGSTPGSDAAPEAADATPESGSQASSESESGSESSADQDDQPAPLQADGEPVDHGPLEQAEEAIEEAKAASGRVEQSGGTFGGDVTEDVSVPGAGDDRDTGVDSADEGTSDTH